MPKNTRGKENLKNNVETSFDTDYANLHRNDLRVQGPMHIVHCKPGPF